jgi:hypothetical protein
MFRCDIYSWSISILGCHFTLHFFLSFFSSFPLSFKSAFLRAATSNAYRSQAEVVVERTIMEEKSLYVVFLVCLFSVQYVRAICYGYYFYYGPILMLFEIMGLEFVNFAFLVHYHYY